VENVTFTRLGCRPMLGSCVPSLDGVTYGEGISLLGSTSLSVKNNSNNGSHGWPIMQTFFQANCPIAQWCHGLFTWIRTDIIRAKQFSSDTFCFAHENMICLFIIYTSSLLDYFLNLNLLYPLGLFWFELIGQLYLFFRILIKELNYQFELMPCEQEE